MKTKKTKKTKKTLPLPSDVKEKIVSQVFEEEMTKSYIDYSMSVIAARALPDVRDGLKPVQRRVLYDMNDIGNKHDKPFRKSAKSVGDTLARFHPHGDSSTYGALTAMGKDWIYNHPYIEKHGNFGSIEGDGPAAMRYCVTGDTLVNTNKGLQRIKDIAGKVTKENSDNPINITVKSRNGVNNKSDMLFNSSYQKIYEIILENGMQIRVSDNHPILIRNRKGRELWIPASKLERGDNCIIDTCIKNALYGTNNDYAEAINYAKQYRKKMPKEEMIPSRILEGDRNYLLIFIKELFKNKSKFATKSKIFARELQILLATQLGILSKILYSTSQDMYIVCIEKENKDYSSSKIKYINIEKKKDIVYSIRVNSDCHSFTGNAFINHNTEARLSKITQDVFFSDMNKTIVDYVPNFDDTEKEPTVLPAKIPSLLVSGSEGIAVGMACSIPSHNLGEVIDAAILALSKKKITTEEILEVMPGPDFATGGVISNKKDLLDIYKTGQGKIRIRGKVETNENNGKPQIIISEIPITMVGAIDKFMGKVAELVRDKKAPDIVDIRNLSSKEGIKIIVDLKKGANVQQNINILYKKAQLEDTFGFNLLAISEKRPRTFNIVEYFNEFTKFQLEIYTRKYNHLLNEELLKKEKKEGLLKAIDCIDLIIEILRGSKTKSDARNCLTQGIVEKINFKTAKSKKLAEKLNFTEIQADEILTMPLQNLIGLELDAIISDLKKTEKNIDTYNGYLNNDTKMKNHIKSVLKSIKENYAIPRKTVITDSEEIVLIKQEIEEQNCYVLIDRFRYIKLIDEATYERNKESITKDFRYCINIKNTDKLALFTKNGKLNQITVLNIPLTKYKDKGVPIENISNLETSDDIIYIDSMENISKGNLLFVSNTGYGKIVKGSEFISSKKTIVSTKLLDNTFVQHISILNKDNDEILIYTKNGFYLRFKISEISEMKKVSVGVRCIKMKNDDNLKDVVIGNSHSNFYLDEKEIPFSKIKLAKRDGVGTKSKI